MKSIKVSFLGNEYLVKTDADENYVREIAQYLENVVKETSSNLGNIKVPLPLFLSTLKVADDLFRLKREYEEYKSRAEDKTGRLVAMLDEALEGVESEQFESEEEIDNKNIIRKPGTFKSWS